MFRKRFHELLQHIDSSQSHKTARYWRLSWQRSDSDRNMNQFLSFKIMDMNVKEATLRVLGWDRWLVWRRHARHKPPHRTTRLSRRHMVWQLKHSGQNSCFLLLGIVVEGSQSQAQAAIQQAWTFWTCILREQCEVVQDMYTRRLQNALDSTQQEQGPGRGGGGLTERYKWLSRVSVISLTVRAPFARSGHKYSHHSDGHHETKLKE